MFYEGDLGTRLLDSMIIACQHQNNFRRGRYTIFAEFVHPTIPLVKRKIWTTLGWEKIQGKVEARRVSWEGTNAPHLLLLLPSEVESIRLLIPRNSRTLSHALFIEVGF